VSTQINTFRDIDSALDGTVGPSDVPDFDDASRRGEGSLSPGKIAQVGLDFDRFAAGLDNLDT
jgi:hypothetical protein